MTVAGLVPAWRERAAALEEYAPAACRAFEVAAAELEAALRARADEKLTLAEAVRESGYSDRRLREFLADGVIPNAGRPGAPRIRRSDLPRKAKRTASRGYDPVADARALAARGQS